MIASVYEENGAMETWVYICSSGLSSVVSIKLVNTLSPSITGGCLDRKGLVLCREWVSASTRYFSWILSRSDSFDFFLYLSM